MKLPFRFNEKHKYTLFIHRFLIQCEILIHNDPEIIFIYYKNHHYMETQRAVITEDLISDVYFSESNEFDIHLSIELDEMVKMPNRIYISKRITILTGKVNYIR